MENQSGHASATLALFLNATNRHSLFMGTLAVTILLCVAESLSSQESKVRVNQGNGLRRVELAARNSLPAPGWLPPFTIAQQLWHTPAAVNLGPTINLLFADIHPASSRNSNLSLTPSTRPGQPHMGMKFLANDEGKLSHEPFAAIPLASGRFQVAHVAPAESERSQRLPAVYQEDTPFSSQVRMPVADLWRGRLQFDGFYREISTDSVFRGILQSNGVWATPGTLAPRSATSYGIRLSFRMPHIHTRTLCRYFVGGRR